MFRNYPERPRIFSFTFQDEDRQQFSAGKTRLLIGRTRILSEITQESEVLSYAILYLGEHNLSGGVRAFDSTEAYDRMFHEIRAANDSADFAETIRLIDAHFGKPSYSIKSLFKDDQRRILDGILSSLREDLEGRFRLITERYTPLMKFLRSLGVPFPAALQSAADFILHSDLRRQFESDGIDLERLRALLQEAGPRGPQVLDADISFLVKNKMERMIEQLKQNPNDADQTRVLEQVAAAVMPLPLGLNLWKVQNIYFEMLHTVLPEWRWRAEHGWFWNHDWDAPMRPKRFADGAAYDGGTGEFGPQILAVGGLGRWGPGERDLVPLARRRQVLWRHRQLERRRNRRSRRTAGGHQQDRKHTRGDTAEQVELGFQS